MTSINKAVEFAYLEMKKERNALRAETARQSKELAEQSIKLLVINEIAEERDALRAELDAVKDALKPFADAYTASLLAHEYDINAGPPPWDFLEGLRVWMDARDVMKDGTA